MKLRTQHARRFNILTLLAHYGRWLKQIPLLPVIIDEQLKLVTFFFYPLRFQKIKAVLDAAREQFQLETCFHRYGGTELRWNNQEIAHLHSNGILDIQFPKLLSLELINANLTCGHHVYPASGWTSCYITASTNTNYCIHLIRWRLQLSKKEKTIDDIKKEIKSLKYAVE